MATTISASADLDSAARPAGEAFTVTTGATLTINTDTRWHKNAPSGADWGKGSIGSLTATAATGGIILIDATDVKWVPFTTTAPGNVPALGTTITGLTSGKTGELLGVYDTIAVAPTAVGSAMPANGFLKFKSTSGSFNAAETLDTFAGCDTNGATVTGWIEVAMDETMITTISRTSKFQTRGDWFYLDDTTGARSQSLQAPNPGGANTYYPAVWIEDGFLDGAMADDGGTFTDETGAANQDTADDMTLLPAAPAVDDAYYFGYYDATYITLKLNLTTQGAGTWVITWEYWDGNSWEALAGISDGTTGFTAATGWKTVSWNLPGDWERTTVNNVNAYWVRARVSDFTNIATQPKGGQAGINGSDVYTKWPAIQGTTYLGASHQGKDERSKFVSCQGGGLLVIGNNSVADVGALPVPGCHTRIPNILLNSCATGDRTANTVPHATLATRPDFLTTSAGQIDIEYTLGDWYFSFSQPYSVSIKYSATFDRFDITECATEVELEDFCNGNYKHGDEAALTMTDDRAGITITNCNFGRTGTIGSADYGINIQYSNDITIEDCHFGNRAFRTHAGAYVCYFAYCDTVSVDNLELVGSAINAVAAFTITMNDIWYADSYHQISSATTPPVGGIIIGSGCKTVKLTGGGWYTRIANMHPDTAYLYCVGATDVRWQNTGTLSLPINGGSSNNILYAYSDAGRNINVEIKRVYFSNIGTRFINGTNSSTRLLMENCAGDYADAMGTSATAGLVTLNATVKNHAAASQYTGFTAVYGTIFYNIYTSVSAGRLGLAFNEDTAYQTGYVTKTFTGASGFTSAGTLALQSLNDNIIYEYPYWIYGIDSFQNLNVVISGTNTANHTVQYQIDTGTGYGALTAATAANLSGEVFTAAGGFRLKIKITCNNASATNALTGCYILTTADTNAQGIQYPLDTYTLTLTGLEIGTMVAFLDTGTETLLSDIQTTTGTTATYDYPDTDAGDTVDIAILKAGYYYQKISYTLTAADASIPIVMETDLAYDTADSDVTFDGATHRIIVDAAVTTLDVQNGVYTAWVDWALTGENLKYEQAIRSVGGDEISVSKDLGITYFLMNDWRIRPDEDDYTLSIEGNIYTDPAGSSVVVHTLGAFNVVAELVVSNLVESSLAQQAEIEYASYEGGVTIDAVGGTDSSTYPYGTPLYPCKTTANSYAIRLARGFTKIYLKSDLTLTGIADGVLNNLDIIGIGGHRQYTITVDSVLVTNCIARNVNVTGLCKDGSNATLDDCYVDDLKNGTIFCYDCYIDSGTYLETELIDCYITGDLKVEAGGYLSGIRLVYEGDNSNIDMQSAVCTVSQDISSGVVEIKNAVAGCLAEFNLRGGELVINANCVGGDLYIEGYGILTNNGTMTIKGDNLLTEDIAVAVWDEPAASHTTAGSFGQYVTKIKSWVGWLRSLL